MKKIKKKILIILLLLYSIIQRIFIKKDDLKQFIKKARNVLLIPRTGIGDVIQFTPVIRSLKEAFPHLFLIIIVQTEQAKEVLKKNPFINKIIVKNIHALSLSELWKLKNEIKPIDVLISTGGVSTGILGTMLKAKYRLGFSYDWESWGRLFYTHNLELNTELNEVEDLLRLLEPLNIKFSKPKLEIYFDNEEKKFAENIWKREKLIGKKVIILHTGCDMPQKAWPISYFQKLIKLLLKEENLKIIIVGGDKEIIKVEQLVEEDKIISLVGKTSILQTAAICSKADLAISNDDCVAHIAAAVGVNIISIFGPTNPKRTAPWGNKNNIFVFKSNLPCSPCYKLYSGVINCKFKDDIKCLKLITPEIVFEKVKYLLNESLNE